MATADKDVFDTMVESFVNDRLDDIMVQDTEYARLQDEIWQEKERFNKLDLPDIQRIQIENLIALHIKAIELYSKKAYAQGYMDCVSLLQKIGVAKDV